MCVRFALAVCLLAACGAKPAEPTTPADGAPAKPSPEVEQSITKMTEFQKHMCECVDKACMDKVANDMAAWSEAQAKKYAGHEPVPSDEQQQRMAKIGEELAACMTRDGAAPAPAPTASE